MKYARTRVFEDALLCPTAFPAWHDSTRSETSASATANAPAFAACITKPLNAEPSGAVSSSSSRVFGATAVTSTEAFDTARVYPPPPESEAPWPDRASQLAGPELRASDAARKDSTSATRRSAAPRARCVAIVGGSLWRVRRPRAFRDDVLAKRVSSRATRPIRYCMSRQSAPDISGVVRRRCASFERRRRRCARRSRITRRVLRTTTGLIARASASRDSRDGRPRARTFGEDSRPPRHTALQPLSSRPTSPIPPN